MILHIAGYDPQGIRLAMTVCGENTDHVDTTPRIVQVTCPRCCLALIQQLARQGGLTVTVPQEGEHDGS